MGPILVALLRALAVGTGALISVMVAFDPGFWVGAAITAGAFVSTLLLSVFPPKKKEHG